MHATNYLQQAMLNVARGVDMINPGGFYIGIYTSDPTVSGTAGTEVSYSGYVRQLVNWTITNNAGDSSGKIENTSQISFPIIPRNTVQTVTHVGILDSPTPGEGNMYLFAPLATPVPLQDTVRLFFAARALKWVLSGVLHYYYRAYFLPFFNGSADITGFDAYLALGGSNDSEPSANYGYERQALLLSLSATGGVNRIYNTVNIDFPECTNSWGSITSIMIKDAASGGRTFAKIPLEQSFTPTRGSQVRVNAQGIEVRMQDLE